MKDLETNSFHSYHSFGTLPYHFGSICPYTPNDTHKFFLDPMTNNEQVRTLCNLAYSANPIISNGVDYIVALPTLDSVLVANTTGKTNKTKIKQNKETVKTVMNSISDKSFIRDALFRDCLDGSCAYYFNTDKPVADMTKFMGDYDVWNICEINGKEITVDMFSLPIDWVRLVGYKNGRAVIAFNLEYFDNLDSEANKTRKLKAYPTEITKAYNQWVNNNKDGNNWFVLDNRKTIFHKVKSKKREPFGRPLILPSVYHWLFGEHLTETKHAVLDDVNNRIVYETFPEGERKGLCALSETQQKDQHEKVKQAVLTKNQRGGVSFFSVSAGTKIGTLDTSVDILDKDVETDLPSNIAIGIGLALGLLDGKSGSYASQQINLDLAFARVYTWVQELCSELNYVINANIVKDEKNRIDIYYLPTSRVNKDKFVSYNKELYMSGNGSKAAWIASMGWDVDAYISLCDREVEEKWDEKYVPHSTAYTKSADNSGGRPTVDNPTNDSTLQTRNNNSNSNPKPSTA